MRRRVDRETATDSTAARAFHQSFPGYERSPLRPVPSLADVLGLRAVWIKDESHRLGLSSFKCLGAFWAAYRALSEATGTEPEYLSLDELGERVRDGGFSLVAATDGNHGRAVARIAKILGMPARIFVPTSVGHERIDAISSEGADVIITHGTYDEAVARSAAEATLTTLVISDTAWPGYETVPRWVIEGYATIFGEVTEQLAESGEGEPDVVVVPIGVGALAAAAASHYAGGGEGPTRLIGVEPSDAACMLESVRAGGIVGVPGPHRSAMVGLNCGFPSPLAWGPVSSSFDLFCAIGDDWAFEGMRLLASERVVAGETGAAALGALLALRHSLDGEAALSALGVSGESSALILVTEGATDRGRYDQIVGAGS